MSAADRLEQMLVESEAERKRLAKKCNALLKQAKHSWARHRDHKTDQWAGGTLPVPRLQMTYRDLSEDWTRFECRYSLVTRHFLGHLVEIPMGITRIGLCTSRGAPVDSMGGLYHPFRDGAHIAHDSEAMRLPAFRIHGDRVEPVNALATVWKEGRS